MSLLVYDATVKFCDRFVNPKSRTHDQMVQAARSGFTRRDGQIVPLGLISPIPLRATHGKNKMCPTNSKLFAAYGSMTAAGRM
jgi:hypothetical protein